MPKFADAFKTKEIELPSYPGSKVTIRTKLPVSDVLEAEALKDPVKTALHLAVKAILNWNFDDDEGKAVEINDKNIKKLPSDDFEFLLGEVKNEVKKKQASDKI